MRCDATTRAWMAWGSTSGVAERGLLCFAEALRLIEVRVHGASYQLIELVAHGGMGSVYLARYRDEADFVREVAVKLLRRDVGELDELGRRLRDEARLLGLLRHPAIVRVDRLALLDGRWALVMEFVDGLDLRELASCLVVPTGVALEVIEVVADALDSAGLARDPQGRSLALQHRDIKPSNIMVTAHGEVKVLDFGVAQARFQGRESSTQSLQLGTTDYMAPERLAGGPGSPAADVFGLGAVLWEVLMGERLGQTSPQLVQHGAWLDGALRRLELRRPQATPGLQGILRDMLAWSPQERPGAAMVVERCAGLARALGDAPLRTWCRTELRELERSPASSDPLVGTVLTPTLGGGEPTPWPSGDEPTWDDRTALSTTAPVVPVVTGPSPRDGELVPPTDEPVSDKAEPARAPISRPPASIRSQPPRRPALTLGFLAAVALLGAGLFTYLQSQSSRPSPEPEPEAPARVVEKPAAVQQPVSSKPRPTALAPVPRPEPIVVPSAPAESPPPDPGEADVGGSPATPSPGPAPAPSPSDGSVWSGVRPGGSLSTAGLEAAPAAAEQVWGARTDEGAAGVSWTDGVRVELSGDAVEVVLVDEERGFPVPGVVPRGSWFVRVRFGEGPPVVAGVVEIEGDGPHTLRCDAHLSWCSLQD